LIVAAGCYAQRATAELEQIESVDLVFDSSDKNALVDSIVDSLDIDKNSDRSYCGNGSPIRTRSLIKIQDGCNDFCSFCIVPFLRGRERSIASSIIIKEIESRIADGYREVTLTGTKIGAFECPEMDIICTNLHKSPILGLINLIERILNETSIERLRLSSLQPHDLTPELLKLFSEKRICSHLHIPLQSGSDSVLKRMRRKYSTYNFEKAVYAAREAIPDLAVTTDLVIGFPGESEQEFEDSYHFCQKIGFPHIHVFPYSPRPGTSASQLPDQVDNYIKRERTNKILELSNESAKYFKRQFIGRVMLALWEQKTDDGQWSGLTENYLRVFAKGDESLSNQILPVRLVEEYGQGLRGELVDGRQNG
jgi:threonylcarbamoyladenosine tRNA methylthiotransferase MtaB